jgi:hypothetical protein
VIISIIAESDLQIAMAWAGKIYSESLAHASHTCQSQPRAHHESDDSAVPGTLEFSTVTQNHHILSRESSQLEMSGFNTCQTKLHQRASPSLSHPPDLEELEWRVHAL